MEDEVDGRWPMGELGITPPACAKVLYSLRKKMREKNDLSCCEGKKGAKMPREMHTERTSRSVCVTTCKHDCTRTDTMDGGMAWGRDEGTVASRQCCRRPRPCTRQYSPVANVLLRVVSCDADAAASERSSISAVSQRRRPPPPGRTCHASPRRVWSIL